MNQKAPPPQQIHPMERQRITVDVSPAILALLDNFCEVTGQARAGVLSSLLATHLPALHDHAKELRNRARELGQGPKRT